MVNAPMTEVAVAAVTLIPSFKGGGKAIRDAIDDAVGRAPSTGTERAGDEAGKRYGKGFKKGFNVKSLIPAAAIAAGGAAMSMFLKDTVSAASDAEQSIGAIESIYGKHADAIIQKSQQAAGAVGMNANEYRELASSTGALLNSKGIQGSELVTTVDDLMVKASDLSAAFGGSASDAMAALNSAMKGETDPIEKYGISLNEAAVKSEIAAMGLEKMAQTAPEQAKALARLNIIQKQSAAVQGQFARENDTYAGKMQRMSAAVTNLKTTIGTALLPVVTKLVTVFAEKAVPLLEDWITQFTTGTGPIGNFKEILVGVVDAVTKVVEWGIKHKELLKIIGLILTPLLAGFLIYQTYTAIMTGLLRAQTTAQLALNTAMSLNPIGLIIAAVAALGVGIYLLWTRNKNFREGVIDIWNKIKDGISGVVTWLTDTAIPKIIGGFQKVKDTITDGIDAVKGGASAWWEHGMFGKGGLFNRQGSYASGGVLPGYSPGRDIYSFMGPGGMRLNLSGGEGILRPEVVRALGPGWLHWLNGTARRGGVGGVRKTMGFASGGVFSPSGAGRASSLGGSGSGLNVNVYVQNADGEFIRREARVVVEQARRQEATMARQRRGR